MRTPSRPLLPPSALNPVPARQSAAEQTRAIAAYVAALRAQLGERLPADLPLVALEVQSDGIAPLPRSRRLLYRAHLHALIENGWEDAKSDGPPPSYADSPPELSAISAATCSACGGRCCRHGGTQAYISHDSLRLFRHIRPTGSPDEFVATYAERLAAQTYAGSCVQHSGTGCTLPRGLRSETCNRHFCEELLHIQALRQQAGPDFRCLLVRLREGRIDSCVLLSEQGFELLDSDPAVRLAEAAHPPTVHDEEAKIINQ